ncbi:MAG: hypothetical protein WD577_00440 [Bacteroidales bacterium]
MRRFLAAIVFILVTVTGITQYNILDNEATQKKVERCLYATYGFNFTEAKAIQKELAEEMPQHPVAWFLNALITYWEFFPILPDDPKAKDFISNMDRAIELAGQMLGRNSGSMEGVFFDMHARAFKAMFWADNGKPAKVIADLNNMYRSTMLGIEYKEIFNEFYFSSGLYNYYIEAYVEKHPKYKPLALLFRKGDKKLGLKELEYAINNTTYIRYEARLFMSLIQLNYEKNMGLALDHAAQLYNHFPKNIYYAGQYLIILLHSEQYTVASVLNTKLAEKKEPFHRIIYQLTEGFISEKQKDDPILASKQYKEAIRLSEIYGPIAHLYEAIAYAGLARIADKKEDPATARRHRRSSSRLSDYEFILDFR